LKREDEILFSEGILLGRIHLVGQKASLESVHDYRTVLSILLHCYKLCNNLKAATLVLVHRFCRILFYDRFAPEDLIYTSELELMERIMGAIVLLGEEICLEEVIDEELVALKERFPIKKWWARSWVSGACDTIENQRFYVSNSGLMGLGPSSLESGDMICVLPGCWVPVVLPGSAKIRDFAYRYGLDRSRQKSLLVPTPRMDTLEDWSFRRGASLRSPIKNFLGGRLA
jgi:hypothetical protein